MATPFTKYAKYSIKLVVFINLYTIFISLSRFLNCDSLIFLFLYYCDKINGMNSKGNYSMQILELEYRGLNLMDVVKTVEVAIDAKNNIIHIYDTEHIVEPEYHFQTKSYKLSEGFFKMANVLKRKQFFLNNHEENTELWVEQYTWIFYCSNQTIKYYRGGKMSVSTKNQLKDQEKFYFTKYFCRLMEK